MKSSGFSVRGDEEGIFWLAGEFDLAQQDVFKSLVFANLDGNKDVVLDCSELTFLDSSGIRAILKFASTVPRDVVIRNPSTNVRTLLSMVGVGKGLGVRIDPERPQ
jgi:anti-anti-sigma factor